MNEKISSKHLERPAILYIRQSSQHQVVHNEESRRLQYAMKPRLLSLGWKEVDIIDQDLGRSAATAADRSGFQRMVSEVCLGKVGAVAAREVSRFARNNRDWHQLIEMCSLVDTLLIDHETIYNPRHGNDRLLLGLKGSLSEYELDLLRQRSLEARRAKARRGELVITAPVGYLKTTDQRLEKDPDGRVQNAIRVVFDKCLQLGSARQTLMWFLEHGLQIPTSRHGAAGWETIWRRPAYRSVIRLLKDPTYAGAYAYGRTGIVSRVRDGVLEKRCIRKRMEDWSVLIRDHHDAYITWEQFERVQQMIAKNISDFRTQVPGAAKRGPALLAGLLRCRKCGRKLMVAYTGRNHAVPRYCCRRGHLDSGDPRCISLGGIDVDEAVARELLRVVQPAGIEAAVLAASEQTDKHAELLDALLIELKAARYAADRAFKQYDGVDPDNRLVTDELERRWDAALERVRALEKKVESEQQLRHTQGEPPTTDALTELAMDLERVWSAPETDVRLKKRIVRTLIEEVAVDVDAKAGEITLVIHWKGGVHSELRVPRRRRGQNRIHAPLKTVEAVRTLAHVCSDDLIASYLNRNGIRTGRGNRWTRERVASLRSKRKIPRHTPHRQQTGGWMNLGQAASHVGVSPKTLRRAAERSAIAAQHPLPDGPWVFNQKDLDAFDVEQRSRPTPAGPHSRQLALTIPKT